MQSTPLSERIFVSIPAYRDSECQHTIRSLYERAAHPERVIVGLCWQGDPVADAACFTAVDLSPYRDRIREVRFLPTEARGPCWARCEAQRLWRGEEYHLAIDSHMRFIQNWDTVLLSLLASCPTQKAVLTSYPPPYELPDKLCEDKRPPLFVATSFDSDGMLRLSGRTLATMPSQSTPLPTLFWAAGFSFSSSKVIEEVPYDPHLEFLFFGEEISMAARLWTAGWDFYAPPCVIIFHLWSREGRPTFRENHDEQRTVLQRRSQERVRYLLAMQSQVSDASALTDLGKYGLRTERTLSAFSSHTGVDFAARKVSERARYGGRNRSDFAGERAADALALVQAMMAAKK